MMTLTILDFLVGEEINIFLLGIKIERMHAQQLLNEIHKFSLWLLL